MTGVQTCALPIYQEWAAYRPKDSQNKVAMTFFIGCEDQMEEEARNAANSSITPAPLQDEEMTFRIQQDDKVHTFLEGMGLRPLAWREATQALS